MRHSPTLDRRIVSGPRAFLPASPTTACARSSTRRSTPTRKATGYLVETLITRKNKVLKSWLNATNPLVNLSLSPTGELTFENAAHKAGVAPAAERYTIQWSSFDNASNTHKDVGAEQTVTSPAAQAPAALLSARPGVHCRARACLPWRTRGVVATADGLFPPQLGTTGRSSDWKGIEPVRRGLALGPACF